MTTYENYNEIVKNVANLSKEQNNDFTLNELSFINHILDRMTDDNDLRKCFTHFSTFEIKDFINKCQQCCNKELSYDNFDVLINTYLDKCFIDESLEYIKNNINTLSLEQQFDYMFNIRKQLDMLLENKV